MSKEKRYTLAIAILEVDDEGYVVDNVDFNSSDLATTDLERLRGHVHSLLKDAYGYISTTPGTSNRHDPEEQL